MSKLLILLLVSFTTFLSGKETKKIVRKIDFNGLKETFYVLKSDTSVRHGAYILESNEKVLIEGYYQMGVKDSVWIQYNLKGIIRTRGWIKNNRRDGLWEYYNYLGDLEQKIDFSKNEVLYYQTTFANYPFMIFTGTDTIVSILERPPLYIGGAIRFNEFVADEIRLPLHKPGEKIMGTVYVRFTIDSTGTTSNHHVLKGCGRACNAEALRVIKSIPDDWMPGMFNGKFISTAYIVTVKFDNNLSSPLFPLTF